jgi:hypothetical protein
MKALRPCRNLHLYQAFGEMVLRPYRNLRLCQAFSEILLVRAGGLHSFKIQAAVSTAIENPALALASRSDNEIAAKRTKSAVADWETG